MSVESNQKWVNGCSVKLGVDDRNRNELLIIKNRMDYEVRAGERTGDEREVREAALLELKERSEAAAARFADDKKKIDDNIEMLNDIAFSQYIKETTERKIVPVEDKDGNVKYVPRIKVKREKKTGQGLDVKQAVAALEARMIMEESAAKRALGTQSIRGAAYFYENHYAEPIQIAAQRFINDRADTRWSFDKQKQKRLTKLLMGEDKPKTPEEQAAYDTIVKHAEFMNQRVEEAYGKPVVKTSDWLIGQYHPRDHIASLNSESSAKWAAMLHKTSTDINGNAWTPKTIMEFRERLIKEEPDIIGSSGYGKGSGVFADRPPLLVRFHNAEARDEYFSFLKADEDISQQLRANYVQQSLLLGWHKIAGSNKNRWVSSVEKWLAKTNEGRDYEPSFKRQVRQLDNEANRTAFEFVKGDFIAVKDYDKLPSEWVDDAGTFAKKVPVLTAKQRSAIPLLSSLVSAYNRIALKNVGSPFGVYLFGGGGRTARQARMAGGDMLGENSITQMIRHISGLTQNKKEQAEIMEIIGVINDALTRKMGFNSRLSQASAVNVGEGALGGITNIARFVSQYSAVMSHAAWVGETADMTSAIASSFITGKHFNDGKKFSDLDATTRKDYEVRGITEDIWNRALARFNAAEQEPGNEVRIVLNLPTGDKPVFSYRGLDTEDQIVWSSYIKMNVHTMKGQGSDKERAWFQGDSRRGSWEYMVRSAVFAFQNDWVRQWRGRMRFMIDSARDEGWDLVGGRATQALALSIAEVMFNGSIRYWIIQSLRDGEIRDFGDFDDTETFLKWATRSFLYGGGMEIGDLFLDPYHQGEKPFVGFFGGPSLDIPAGVLNAGRAFTKGAGDFFIDDKDFDEIKSGWGKSRDWEKAVARHMPTWYLDLAIRHGLLRTLPTFDN